MASASTADPQTFNRYTYALNSPYRYADPTGMEATGEGWGAEDYFAYADAGAEAARQAERDAKEQGQQQQQDIPNPYTRTTGNPVDVAIDAELAKLFTDGGIVVGADAFSNQGGRFSKDSHYQLADGTLHTIHVLGGKGGNKIIGVYAPKAFSQIEYEGGHNGIVTATNPKTGEILGFAHVDVTKAQLARNQKKTNAAESRLLGNIGGPGANGKPSVGDRHVHVTYFVNAAARTAALSGKVATDVEMNDFGSKHAQYLRNFRTLVPR